jgi:hypothetical protein
VARAQSAVFSILAGVKGAAMSVQTLARIH